MSANEDRDPPSRTELAGWARTARDGDAEAYGRLVLAHARALRRILARYATAADDVDDLVQETFVRAWESFDRFDPERPFGPWLTRVGIRLALDRRRARAARAEGRAIDDEEALERIAVAASAVEETEADQLRRAVDEELESMRPEWAEVLRLRAIGEMGYAEIAATLDVPIGTVMSRLARARARLATALSRRFGPLGPLAKDSEDA